jgi:putative ATP-binding cassette transporter
MGHGRLWLVSPLLLRSLLPHLSIFSGGLTFGGLMMAVGAFTQVHNSLRWFVDNFGAIADWRATLLRVASFRQAILRMDEIGHIDRQIVLETNEDERLTIEALSIAVPDGCLNLVETNVSIGPGSGCL